MTLLRETSFTLSSAHRARASRISFFFLDQCVPLVPTPTTWHVCISEWEARQTSLFPESPGCFSQGWVSAFLLIVKSQGRSRSQWLYSAETAIKVGTDNH